MAARRIHLDNESGPTTRPAVIERITAKIRTKEPAKSWSKAEKEAWTNPESVESRVREAIADTAKNSLLAELLCVSVKTEAGDTVQTFDAMEQPITRCLGQFVEWANDTAGQESIWIAFNGLGYDLPQLVVAMAKHRIMPPIHFPVPNGNGWKGRIFDTMQRQPHRDQFTSLVVACEAYGIDAKSVAWKGEPMSGGRVAEAFLAGEFELIREYNRQDVRDEEALYLAMTHGDTWATYDTGSDTLRDAYTLLSQEPGLTDSQRWKAFAPTARAYGWA